MDLVRHPSCQSAVDRISVDLSRSTSGLSLTFIVRGEISTLVIPPAAEPARSNELWRKTCFELFTRGEGLAYSEFNFSPSGQWAAYAFESYRSGMRELEIAGAPAISATAAPDHFRLIIKVALQLPDTSRIALSAVIEEQDGGKSYWALAHPEGPPDFHHDTCFAATLADIAGA